MKRPYRFGLGLVLTLALALTSMPAMARTGHRASPRSPLVSVQWSIGPNSPFNATRFDGALVRDLNRVYFLGFRTDLNATDGSIWYLDLATSTFTDTGVDMPIPISNYQISPLNDAHGLGLYVFGGRDANGAIIKPTQVYYPADNAARIITSDPFPGQTPSGCVSLPGMGVATYRNRAFVLGGASFSSSVPPCVDDNSAQTWIFNPMAAAGSRWTQGPDLNQARGYITSAVLNGRIYAIGGDVNTAGTLFAQSTVEAWKPPSGGWNDLGVNDLPEMCDESQAFAFTSGPLAGDIVLASCGQWPNGNGDTWLYDSAANSWTLAGAIKFVVRNEAGEMLIIGGRPTMYILGGYTADSSFIDPTNVGETGKPGPLGPDGALRRGSAGGASRAAPNN